MYTGKKSRVFRKITLNTVTFTVYSVTLTVYAVTLTVYWLLLQKFYLRRIVEVSNIKKAINFLFQVR